MDYYNFESFDITHLVEQYTGKKLEELFRSSRGMPAFLDAIKRIIKSGVSVDELIDEFPEHLKDLFEIEWNRYSELSEELRLILAILALDKRQSNLSDIALLSKLDVNVVKGELKNISFIVSIILPLNDVCLITSNNSLDNNSISFLYFS